MNVELNTYNKNRMTLSLKNILKPSFRNEVGISCSSKLEATNEHFFASSYNNILVITYTYNLPHIMIMKIWLY